MEVDEGSDIKSDMWPHWMTAHAHLKNEFTEDEKCHNPICSLCSLQYNILISLECIFIIKLLYPIYANSTHPDQTLCSAATDLHCLIKTVNEPTHEIMVLFVLRKLIFQTRMHPVGRDVCFWSDPLSTSILHVCEQQRLWRDCSGSSEPLLVANVISTIIWVTCRVKRSFLIEPQHSKTNKMICAPSKDSDQPGHPPSLIGQMARLI